MHSDLTIRRAGVPDLQALGRLGALLMRTHHEFDSRRFLAPGDHADQGYAAFLETQLGDPDAIVLVAEREGDLLGYVFAAIEPLSWKELRDRAGYIHDIVVDARGRRTGVATALIEAAITWMAERDIPRVVLQTADANADAQRLFANLGFRRTMVEMTREIG